MVMEFGMSSLGPINFDNEMKTAMGRFYTEPVKLSEGMLEQIDNEVQKIIGEGLKLAASILKKQRKLLDEVSKRLIEIETMDGEEFEKLMGHNKDAVVTLKY